MCRNLCVDRKKKLIDKLKLISMGSLSSKRTPTPAQIMAATQFVKDAIAHDPIVIFSKSDCGYCQMAKEV